MLLPITCHTRLSSTNNARAGECDSYRAVNAQRWWWWCCHCDQLIKMHSTQSLLAIWFCVRCTPAHNRFQF